MSDYDSTAATRAHIERVGGILLEMVGNLVDRSRKHDNSKLQDPEKSIFDEYTPKLRDTTYGSSEYKQFLEEMRPALDHHYQHNRHHPEHWENGILDMSLLDLLELLADWKAASERHADGDILRSLELNTDRFAIPEELAGILRNTIRELGWIDGIRPEQEDVLLRNGYSPKDTTCFTCPDNKKCEWAWDLYNTDGDCLALK